MTGFGRAVLETEGKCITVEIRTLNSKQLDLNTRIPLLFKNYENDIRSILSNDGSSDKALLDLCFDVIYHSNMKATGLGNLIALYRQWEKEKVETDPTTQETE